MEKFDERIQNIEQKFNNIEPMLFPIYNKVQTKKLREGVKKSLLNNVKTNIKKSRSGYDTPIDSITEEAYNS